jgi:hypothetical protein
MTERSTTDLVILIVTVTICSLVALGGITLLVLMLVYPEMDVSPLASAVSHAFGGLVGLLAGFLMGRSRRSRD